MACEPFGVVCAGGPPNASLSIVAADCISIIVATGLSLVVVSRTVKQHANRIDHRECLNAYRGASRSRWIRWKLETLYMYLQHCIGCCLISSSSQMSQSNIRVSILKPLPRNKQNLRRRDLEKARRMRGKDGPNATPSSSLTFGAFVPSHPLRVTVVLQYR
jgi:hypothetical protein